MTGKKVAWLAIVAGIVIVAGIGWKLTSRTAYESAPYTVLESDGRFEVREYPDLMLASTKMLFDSQRDDGSFMRLFRYIGGANEDKQKVAMTTPVFMEPETPQSEGQMGFVIPQQVAAKGIPQPTASDVQLQRRSGGRFAVIRFSGRMTSESVQAARQKLLEWMNGNQLTADGRPELAGYDPPWTPGPFRRNEMLVRLK